MDEEFRFFGVGRAGGDEEDVGKSQYFDALETVEEVEEAIAQAAVVHAEDGLRTTPSVRLERPRSCGLCILVWLELCLWRTCYSSC